MTTAIDTLKIYERLKKANLSDEAAKEIAEVFKETSEIKTEIKEELSKELSTKGDLQTAKAELKADIESSKSDIIKWVAAMLVAQASLMAVMFRLLGLLK